MRINPLLTNESRLRMRNWRTFGLLAVYLLILGGIGVMFFSAFSWEIQRGGTDLADVGRNVFIFLSVIQFVMIYFIVPGFTSNSITMEKERQTFDLLVCTQLSPRSIVLGKLVAALNNVVLLIIASLPIYGFIFLLGGVTLGEVIKLVIIYLYAAFVYGSFYTFLSSKFNKSQPAVIISYGLALFLMGMTAVLTAVIAGISYSRGVEPPFPYLMLLHPGAIAEWIHPEVADIIRAMSANAYPFTGFFSEVKFWMISVVINLALGGLSLYLAAVEVNPLKKGKRSG